MTGMFVFSAHHVDRVPKETDLGKTQIDRIEQTCPQQQVNKPL